jgi:succinate dehydrogenase / fumarate reductase flavoprotein subunit
VHGANRLGTNSLLDLLVFGRAAGRPHRAQLSSTHSRTSALPAGAADATLARLARLDGATDWRVRAGRGRRHPRHHAGALPGCFRTAGLHQDEGVDQHRSTRWPSAPRASTLKDKSQVFNTARVEALEARANLTESRAARPWCRRQARHGKPRRRARPPRLPQPR